MLAAWVRARRNTQAADAPPLPWAPLPDDPAELQAYVAAQEGRFADIVPGTEKRLCLGPGGSTPSPWAVVYLHGFSASRQETAPLSETVADALGGAYFGTRLTGHGRGAAAMADASVAAWKADALQALAIGRRLGRRVLVIGASTGGSLAAWLALQPEAARHTAWVLISPNFGPRHRGARVINWVGGRSIARWVTGPSHSFKPHNDLQARYWTTRYPTEALFPMMATVHLARQQPLQDWRTPVLMLVSPRDQVVDPGAARRAFQRIGAAHKRLLTVDDSDHPLQHVLAGQALSPRNTAAVARLIIDWVRTLPAAD